MFHPWKKWEPLVGFLRKPTVQTVKIHPWHRDCSKQTYAKFSNQVCFPIVKFLTGEDLQGQPDQVFRQKQTKMVGADGSAVTSMDNIILANKLTKEEADFLSSEPDQSRAAIELYQSFSA
jgi:hypothetical protein